MQYQASTQCNEHWLLNVDAISAKAAVEEMIAMACREANKIPLKRLGFFGYAIQTKQLQKNLKNNEEKLAERETL